MVGFSGFLSLLATMASLGVRADDLSPPSLGNALGGSSGDSEIIPGSFIVQFVDEAVSGGDGGLLGAVTGTVDGFLDTVQSLVNLDIGITINLQYNYQFFKGVSLDFVDPQSAADGLAKLTSLGNVKQVWPNMLLRNVNGGNKNRLAAINPMAGNDDPLGSIANTALGLADSLTSSSSPPTGDSASSQSGGSSPSSSSPSPPESVNDDSSRSESNVTYSNLQMTQVDKLHEKGIFGSGTRVCIIDSGIDYTHPALGDGFGPGHLVSFGRDLIGDNYSAASGDTPMPDDDPMDICDGHGTSLAGVIAAQPGNRYGIIGVAPNVTLGAYRYSDCDGNANLDIALQAFNLAHADGCQIINLSSGGASGGQNGPLSSLAKKITDDGVLFVAATGNNGEGGLFHTDDPALGLGVVAVGSVDNEYRPDRGFVGNYTVDGGEIQTFKWAPDLPYAWGGVELPLYALRLADPTDKDPWDNCTKIFPDDTPDLSGHITLMPVGYCDPDIMAKAAASHGAKYIMNWQNWNYMLEQNQLDNSTGILASAEVYDTTAKAWLKALDSGSTVTVQMADPKTLHGVLTYERMNVTGGLISWYTAWGLSPVLYTKPQFTAPGGNILTTFPVNQGGYIVDSGTSFSAPFAAGVLALLAQVHGTLDPVTLTNLLSASAKAQVYNNKTAVFPYFAPVPQQGNGLVQAFDAAFTKTLLSRNNIAFNDTDNFEPDANFTIKNLGTEAVTFNIGHSGAPTVYTFAAPGGTDAHITYFNRLNFTQEYATITFNGSPESQVTIPAGGEVQVCLTLTPPAGVDPVRLPIYSGWITLNGTNGENLSLPYTGAAGSMKAVQIIADAYLTETKDFFQRPVNGTPSYTVPYNETKLNDNITYPAVYVDLAFGTRLLDAQLVSWNGTMNGTEEIEAGTNLGSISFFPRRGMAAYLPQSRGKLVNKAFDGTMEDGTIAPEGTYIIQISALKTFGDRSRDVDYEYRRTLPFTIKYSH